MLTGLDIEAKAALVRQQMDPVLAKAADVRWDLARTDHPDADTEETASALLRLVVRDPDQEAVGRVLSGAAIELALASYPGFHVLAPPGKGAPYGVFEDVYVPHGAVPHVAVLYDGRRVPVAPAQDTVVLEEVPEPPLPEPLPPGPVRRAPLGLVAGARSGDKGGNANVGVWARTDDAWRWLAHELTVDRFQQLIPESRQLTVTRHLLPGLRALNFVVEGILGAGCRRPAPLRPAGQSPRRMAALPPPGHPGGPPVTVLSTALDLDGADYRANRETMLAKLADLDAEHAKALAGGGPKYVERHRKRGKLLARERIELLLDPDTPFLELSPLAAWGSDYTVGASLVTGIGVVEGVECLITANDPTVRGGASNPWSLKKALRANDIALANRLPCINLVESGGADLPSQKEIFIPGGAIFRDLTRLSAAGIPTLAVVFGNSTAGGAYVPGMSDHVIMVKERAKVFLGGPPLVKMATGEESDDESLGGAEMHARVSGLADYFAVDEQDALRQARRVVARLNHRKTYGDPGPAEPPKYDADELLGIVPGDLRTPSTRAR